MITTGFDLRRQDGNYINILPHRKRYSSGTIDQNRKANISLTEEARL